MDLTKTAELLAAEFGATQVGPKGSSALRWTQAWLPNGRGVLLTSRPGDETDTAELRTIRAALPTRPSVVADGETPWRLDREAGIEGGVLSGADMTRIRSALRDLAGMPVVTLAHQAYEYGWYGGVNFTRYASMEDSPLARKNGMPPGVTESLVESYDAGWLDGADVERTRKAATGEAGAPLFDCASDGH